MRPRATKEIHAHTTPEAFTIGEHVLTIMLGDEAPVKISIPHPFSFPLLKLFACRDQRAIKRSEQGKRRRDAEEKEQYHAFDLYRIVAMMTEVEFAEAEELRNRYVEDDIVREAGAIAAELFRGQDAPGALAILEHARRVLADVIPEDVSAFTGDLRTLLPSPNL